jgi:hypothetical protein
MTRTLVSTALGAALLSTVVVSGRMMSDQALDPSGPALPAPDVEVRITITGEALYRDGSGPATPSGQAPLGIDVTPSYQFSGTGIMEDGCRFGMSMSMTPDLTPPDPVPPVWWVVTADLVSRQLDGATVDISWQRRLNSPAVTGPAIVERTRRLTLIEGRPHILDYVPVEVDSGNCDALLIQAEVQFVDPPTVADSTLQYEVWLVETEPDGRERSGRIVTSGAQASSIDFAFEAEHFDANGARDGHGPIAMSVGGTLKGRARTDGRIDLVVDAKQWFSLENGGRPYMGRTSYAGTKRLIVSPGEVVEITVPAPQDPLGDVDLQPVFGGRRTALRIVTRTT